MGSRSSGPGGPSPISSSGSCDTPDRRHGKKPTRPTTPRRSGPPWSRIRPATSRSLSTGSCPRFPRLLDALDYDRRKVGEGADGRAWLRERRRSPRGDRLEQRRPEEREQLKHLVPYIEQQQTLTKREIPIVVLER